MSTATPTSVQGHHHGATQPSTAPDGTDSPAAVYDAAPGSEPPQGSDFTDGQSADDTQWTVAVGEPTSPRPAKARARTQGVGAGRGDLHQLRLLAENLTDVERVRIASENRLRALTRDEADADGEIRGLGLTEAHPLVKAMIASVESMRAAEKDATKSLAHMLRATPYGAWVKETVGIGERQGARLLGAVGDPYWNTLHDRPRTVSELWAYCGLHVLPVGRELSDDQNCAAGGEAARRRKGQRSNWSNEAKMRAYLCAVSSMKQSSSPYRSNYVARRAHTATTHPEWTPGHSHNDALRITSKAILRDLWRFGRMVTTGEIA